MKLWWLTDFARVDTEKTAVERLTQDEGWFTLCCWRLNAWRFSADGIITAHDIAYPVRLVYPDQFPLVPAWVEPQDPEARWSSHQYGKGGVLCLELRPDNWSPSASGTDVLRSAYKLLWMENPLGDGEHSRVPSADRISDVQSYDWGTEPVLIGSGCLERLRNGKANHLRALRWAPTDGGLWPILVFDAIDLAQPQHPPSFDLGTLRVELPVIAAQVEAPNPTPADRLALASALGMSLDSDTLKSGVIVITASVEHTTAFHSPDETSVFTRKLVILPDEAGIRSGRTSQAASRSVAVAGLGSVGSKVAEMLLRSGVHRLLLMDGDVFFPGNLERHTLDWRDIGFRKANAVKRRLLHIAPGATIDVITFHLDWQRSARFHADIVGRLAACDLIFDATGDIPSALRFGAIAAENERPFVSAQVFEGGLGCLIARSLPGLDPPYVAGREAYDVYCEKMDVTPPASGHRDYEALNETGQPLVADDAAVTIAAAHASRVVLDIFDERLDSADAGWLLMGFRKGWLFERHGHSISLDVSAVSVPAPPETTDDAGIRIFIADLVKGASGATASPE